MELTFVTIFDSLKFRYFIDFFLKKFSKKEEIILLWDTFFVSFIYFIDFSINSRVQLNSSQKMVFMVALNSIFNPTLLSRAILGNK